MLKDLGNELDEEKLQEALNDLDINKDGVVDFDEFKGWWFSGMKSFSSRRRTLLKVSGGMQKFSAELKGAAADIASNPKTNSHKIEFAFNKPPADCPTKISAKFHVVGTQHDPMMAKANAFRAEKGESGDGNFCFYAQASFNVSDDTWNELKPLYETVAAHPAL